MSYTYETHLHTCRASLCGKSEGSEHVRYYKELGYTGIFVTDHFFGGNTAVPREGAGRLVLLRIRGGPHRRAENGPGRVFRLGAEL